MIINIDAPPPSKTGQSKLSDPAASSPVAAQCIPPFTTQQTDNLREAVIEGFDNSRSNVLSDIFFSVTR
jgi:hypothetical protein